MDDLTWSELLMTLEKRYNVRAGRTVAHVGGRPAQFLGRTLSDGSTRHVDLNVSDGNRIVPPSLLRHILDRLDIRDFDTDD